MSSRARSQSPKSASSSPAAGSPASGSGKDARGQKFSVGTSEKRASSEGKSPPAASASPRRSSWRASSQTAQGSNKYPIYVDISIEQAESRKNQKFQASRIKQALSRKNLSFDRQQGRVSVDRELKFKSRWYGSERVDDPTAEASSDINIFRAVATDLNAIYEAFPGDCTIVRLRKPIQPGTYTEERNKWMEKLAYNQGEFLRQLLLQFGMPEDDIKVEVQTAPADAPAGMFYFYVPVEGHDVGRKREEEALNASIQRITTRKNITFDAHTGRAAFAKGFVWEPRSAVGPKMDAPEAKLVDPASCDRAIQDMAELWHLFKTPARVVTEAPSGSGDPAVEEWCQALARNRAAVIRAALTYYHVPADQITSGIFGDPQMSPRKGPRSDSTYFACATSAPSQDLSKLHRLKVKAMLQQAASLHRVEDIPLLEEALEEARKIRMEEQWSRCDALVSEAEKNLRVLYQRRRRQEAHADFLDRKKALSKIKVSQATRQTMIECGELRRQE